MRQRIAHSFVYVFLVLLGFLSAPDIPVSHTQEVAAKPILKLDGAVRTPLALTIEDLKKMPRKTVSVTNPHDKQTENYEGVLVENLLRKAGVPQGEDLRGPLLASYLVFEAEDGLSRRGLYW